MTTSQAATFWRDPALPFLEARTVDDGRALCYGLHAHDTFSIGLVTGGESTYLNGRTRQRVGAGAIVLMNPGDVHACNPAGERPWAYRMFSVDCGWLAGVQGVDAFQPYADTMSEAPELRRGLAALHAACTDPEAEPLEKESAAAGFFATLHDTLRPAPAARTLPDGPLRRAADYIRDHRRRAVTLDEISAAAGLSPSYLIRAFRARYGMTPHAWLVNCRVQEARERLRRGQPIADAALDAGFADQAHLQRAFKRHLAATPGQYRGRA